MLPIRQPLNPYFVPSSFCFKTGEKKATADGCLYDLIHAPFMEHDLLYISLEDLQRSFGPQLTIETNGTKAEITLNELRTECEIKMKEETAFIAAENIFNDTAGFFKKRFSNYLGSFVCLAKKKPEKFDGFGMGYAFTKRVGILHRALYMEAVKQLVPYHVYIPTVYDESKPLKLAVVLHGLGGQENFEKAGGPLCSAAEKYGYIILSPNGYARGMHGSEFPMKRDFVPDDVDPSNPAGLDEEQKRIYPLCEQADMNAVFHVMDEYAIDKNNVFLFGNSMGSDGTFHLGQKYNTIWRAIAPCGGGCDLRFYPVDRIKNIPVRVVIGTEDPGYEVVHELYQELLKKGINASITEVGGEAHGTAWVKAIDDIFTFFNEQSV
ncbi:hypothetical protein GPL15_14285 [Clostridium sp. MCC353]|uniref:hypothetical protein n=1 Tax=Clostridium sp. MCC353 TaxID=2592646 RepID=UPI001C009AA6|nr:hypothetical protein [Clostridium sp. MCC353]MBT9777669.1 hypothetical protein [Clostridium sp. MCC353]